MSLMDLFRTSPAPQQTAQQTQQTQQSVQTNNTIPNDNTIKSDGTGPTAIPKAAEGEKSPMEKYADLFKVDPNAKGPESPVPNLTPDPAKLADAVKNLDLTSGINKELLTKATSGDQAAMMEVIKQSGQAAVAQTSAVTARIVENALNALNKNYEERIIPDILRKNNANLALADNPILSNPALAPLFEGMKGQFLAKYPDAKPEELNKMTTEYLEGALGLAASLSGKKMVSLDTDNAGNAIPKGKKDVDWEKLLAG